MLFDDPLDNPNLSPWMRHQQEWWSKLVALPPLPTIKKEAHEPLGYDNERLLQNWEREAEAVVDEYEAYLRTDAGKLDLADLEASRAVAHDAKNVIAAARNDSGECRRWFMNSSPWEEFLRLTAHPGIALVHQRLRNLTAQFKRESTDIADDKREYLNAESVHAALYERRMEALRLAPAVSSSYRTHAESVASIQRLEKALREIKTIELDKNQLISRMMDRPDTDPLVVMPDPLAERFPAFRRYQ